MESSTTRVHPPFSEARAASIIARRLAKRGAMLPILHELQEQFGYLDGRAIPLVAGALNLSEAEVYGVVTFYKDFRTEKGGRHLVQVCRAESCQSMGAEALARHAAERIGVEIGETTEDGEITLDEVFCLGNCALSPAVMVDGRLVGRVDDQRLDELVADLAPDGGSGR